MNEIIYLSSNVNDTFSTYRKDIACFYQITSNLSAQISMRINYFDLESDFDFLIIGSGENPADQKSVLARLTGRPKLRTVTSTYQVWLSFITDDSGIATGYAIDVNVTLAASAMKGQGIHL